MGKKISSSLESFGRWAKEELSDSGGRCNSTEAFVCVFLTMIKDWNEVAEETCEILAQEIVTKKNEIQYLSECIRNELCKFRERLYDETLGEEFPGETLRERLYNAYVFTLKSIGKSSSGGIKIAGVDFYKKGFWFNIEDETHFFISRAFLIFAKCVWEDIAKPCLRKSEHSPATTLGTHPIIRKAQNKGSVIKSSSRSVSIYHDDELVAETPLMHPKIIKQLARGCKLLGSVYGHKVVRWQVRKGFEQWKNGDEDFRLLKYDGGFLQIANELGLDSGRGSSAIKDILLAQAHLSFTFGKNNYGNLIVLKQFLCPKTGRDEKLEIVLGSRILPHQTFREFDRRKRLLVPCLDLPPLVGANRTHANQCDLQLEVVEHMTYKSIEMAEEGGVLIQKSDMERMASNVKITKSTLAKVMDRWTNDGDDGGKMLEAVGDDRYKFAEEYAGANKLLLEQGKLRIRNSERGLKNKIRKRKA